MAPVERGWLSAIFDWWFAWTNGLPPGTCSYTVESVPIPVSSDVKLAAELYQPVSAMPSGTLLIRTPYGISPTSALGHARFFAARGYQVLLSSCRGTSGSDGELDMGGSEVVDGHTVVAWMRKQSWYTGSFATLGGSYLGYTQWALLTAPPADMKAAIITTGPHDMSSFTWDTGALYSNIITWADLTARMRRDEGFLSLLLFMRSQKDRLRPVLDSVPLLDAVDNHFEGKAPAWLRESITRPDRTDPIWKPKQHSEALERANIPILLVTGWYDILLRTVIDQYSRLVQRGCKVALTIGPWTHLGAQRGNSPAASLSWLHEHLDDRASEARPSPVRVFITGTQVWRNLPLWPPPTTAQTFFLGLAKTLSALPPAADTPGSTFKFDPVDPTPAIGAPLMFAADKGTSDEDAALAARPDVLSFTTERLGQDLEVCGKPSVTLCHSSSHPHVDLLVVLSEVETNGTSHSISERYMRLDPARGPDPIHLALHDCAHSFRKGNQIRLLIAGGSHPRYIRNLGTGENPGTGVGLRPAWHTVHHNTSALSTLVLPVTKLSSN